MCYGDLGAVLAVGRLASDAVVLQDGVQTGEQRNSRFVAGRQVDDDRWCRPSNRVVRIRCAEGLCGLGSARGHRYQVARMGRYAVAMRASDVVLTSRLGTAGPTVSRAIAPGGGVPVLLYGSPSGGRGHGVLRCECASVVPDCRTTSLSQAGPRSEDSAFIPVTALSVAHHLQRSGAFAAHHSNTTGSAAPVAEIGGTMLTTPMAMPRYSAAIPTTPKALASIAKRIEVVSISGRYRRVLERRRCSGDPVSPEQLRREVSSSLRPPPRWQRRPAHGLQGAVGVAR
jgi:hypothetical protein